MLQFKKWSYLEGNELNSEPVHVSTSDSGSLVTKRHQTGTGNNGSARERDQFHRVYAQGLEFSEDVGMHTRANFTEEMRSLADNHSLFELLDFYSKLRLYCSSVQMTYMPIDMSFGHTCRY